jgi:hypothetical protein
VTAQRRRAAQLDGAHHPPRDAAQMASLGAPIGVTVAAEDVRDFRPGRHGQPAQADGTSSSVSRSSGLSVRPINPFETRV